MGILGPTKEKILREIDRETIHGYELAKRVRISLSSVYEHLSDLRRFKLVETKLTGRRRIYVLTDKGKHILKALE